MYLSICCYSCASAQAIEAVSPNGVLSPKEAKLCLAARSHLQLQLGNYAAALKDAEDALLDDPLYIRGLFAKAEALYFKSDFEFALINFYKGSKVRPPCPELPGSALARSRS